MADNDRTPDFGEKILKKLARHMNQTHPGMNDIGQRIRQLRTARNISIEDLSRITGFSASRLQDMEQGRINPQLGDMMRLSKVLDAAVGKLVSGQGSQPYAITRKNDRRQMERSSADADGKKVYSYVSLAQEVQDRHMEALIVHLEKTDEAPMTTHDGEEFIFVLNGTVHLTIAEETHHLEPGDSAYYLSTTPHYITAGSDSATILAVLYE